MAMILFAKVFPDIAITETRSMMAGVEASELYDLPADQYDFLELYCAEPNCECRRVLINVMSLGLNRHIATISHAFDAHAKNYTGMGRSILDLQKSLERLLGPHCKWNRATRAFLSSPHNGESIRQQCQCRR
jgi:hypothetical protein